MHQTYRRLIALTLCAGLITTAFSTQSEKLWQVSYADTTVSSDDQAQIDDLNNQYEEHPLISPFAIPAVMISQMARVYHSAGRFRLPSASV